MPILLPTHTIEQAVLQVLDGRVDESETVIGTNTIREMSFPGTIHFDEWDQSSLQNRIGAALAMIVSENKSFRPATGPIWIILRDDSKSFKYISTKFATLSAYDFDDVWFEIIRAIQSNEDYAITEITVRWLEDPEDAGSGLINLTTIGSRSFIKVHEYGVDDHLCAQRAIILLAAYKEYTSFTTQERPKALTRRWRMMKRNAANKNSKAARFLNDQAMLLSAYSGVCSNAPIDFKGLRKLAIGMREMVHRPCVIQVFKNDSEMKMVFSTQDPGPIEEKKYDEILWLDLLLKDHHYTPIKHLSRILGCQNKYCYVCKRTYQKSHNCVLKCNLCGTMGENHYEEYCRDRKADNVREWLPCGGCDRQFYDQTCFDNHLLPQGEEKKSMCERKWKCLLCHKVFERTGGNPIRVCEPSEHRCGDFMCTNCGEFVPKNHQCYMKVTKARKETDKYIFCDFEATQENGVHKVNLAVTQYANGDQWPIHTNIHDWLQYLVEKKHGGYTVIFHNGKGYDFQFILKVNTQYIW